ncbi:MAG: sensor histidine kinase, partial [Anaerolineae bacterium]
MKKNDSQHALSQSRTAFLFVVVIGYGIALVGIATDSGWNPSPTAVAFSIFLGVVYMGWAWWGDAYFDRFPFAWAKAVYFGTLMAMILTVQITLGANGTWLLSLPLVAEAVERLQPVWRWPVYVASWLGLALPLWLVTGSVEEAVGVSFAFVPAVFFVVVFTRLRLNEQQAREKAERLTGELEQANRQLAAYAVQAEEMATTQERNRLAREIHDNLGHYLTVVNVQIEAARTVLELDPAKARDSLAKAQKLTKEGLTAVRQSVSALRESPLDNQTLGDA